ncbi:MAG: DUF4352 domain-containing protein [Acidobacteriota bacterium]|nr:DUF4352 domain-containing protein [Acidobacteriota bacterium]
MGVLLMLMTIGGVISAFILLMISIFTKKTWLRNFVFGGVFVWFVSYAILLFAASLLSKDKLLGLNEPKAFCGFYLDCHLHTTVTNVRTTKSLGDKTANGEFYIVKVKVFSDARQATLGLITVDANVFDEQNRKFARDTQAEMQLGEQPPFEKQISPVESFEKEIVFDLPSDARNPRLDIREGYGIDHAIEAVLIDDEDSILHKRNYFKLEQQSQIAGVK